MGKYGCEDVARYAREAEEVGDAVDAMKDPAGPLWLAATVDNRLPDVWGSAYLVALNLSTPARREVSADHVLALC